MIHRFKNRIRLAVESLEGRRMLATHSVDINDANCGAVTSPYCLIQDAVDASASGDLIEVHDGVYPESVLIGKG